MEQNRGQRAWGETGMLDYMDSNMIIPDVSDEEESCKRISVSANLRYEEENECTYK